MREFVLYLILLVGLQCNAQYGRDQGKGIHFIIDHGTWTQEEWDNHLPFDHRYEFLYKNDDGTIGILNRSIRTAMSHYDALYSERIWDIQYNNGKWSTAVARTGKQRREIRKIIKLIKRKN